MLKNNKAQQGLNMDRVPASQTHSNTSQNPSYVSNASGCYSAEPNFDFVQYDQNNLNQVGFPVKSNLDFVSNDENQSDFF